MYDAHVNMNGRTNEQEKRLFPSAHLVRVLAVTNAGLGVLYLHVSLLSSKPFPRIFIFGFPLPAFPFPSFACSLLVLRALAAFVSWPHTSTP